jgi:hypothetical protein
MPYNINEFCKSFEKNIIKYLNIKNASSKFITLNLKIYKTARGVAIFVHPYKSYNNCGFFFFFEQ